MPTTRQSSVMTSRSGELQNRHDGSFAWKTLVGVLRSLPGLRWAGIANSFDENGDLFDLSGQGRTLAYQPNPTYGHTGLVPHIDFDGTNDHLSRGDEAGLDILGTEPYVAAANRGLTFGGMFKFDRLTNAEFLIGKSTGVIATAAYWITFRGDVANDPVQFSISDGAATDNILLTLSPTTASSTWTFVVGRYDPSTEIKIYAGQQAGALQTATNVVGIPAALNNGNGAFTIGSDSAGGNDLDGAMSFGFLCAMRLDDALISSIWHHTRALYGH